MYMYECVCLIASRGKLLLLVRVKDNNLGNFGRANEFTDSQPTWLTFIE